MISTTDLNEHDCSIPATFPPQISLTLEPGSRADFMLTYEELLVRRLGSYELVINVNPRQIVADLRVLVGIDETRSLELE